MFNIRPALVIAGTYAWAVLTAGGPTNYSGYLDGSADTQAALSLPLTLGLPPSALFCSWPPTSPRLAISTLALIPFAAAFKIIVGQLIGFSGIPLYLDSVATVLIGVLAGPAAGAMTGAVTNLAWGLTINPTTIPFAAGAAAIGFLAGCSRRAGLMSKLWTALLAGLGTGLIAGFLGAPIAAFVFGGGQGVGTGSVVAALQAAGQSLLGATTLQSLLSDPLDKTVAFLLVWIIVRGLPNRVRIALGA
ncbi:ECF transporter S component [Rothia sp. P4278]|uniref:ECF transporter S component n=1 Tax=Rothia sp. P4278 TaxID=3402658 RepID=UPI003AE795BB